MNEIVYKLILNKVIPFQDISKVLLTHTIKQGSYTTRNSDHLGRYFVLVDNSFLFILDTLNARQFSYFKDGKVIHVQEPLLEPDII